MKTDDGEIRMRRMIRADGYVTKEKRSSQGRKKPNREAAGHKSIEMQSDETDAASRWPKVKHCYLCYKKHKYWNVK